jgi:hypothetical protein
VLLAAFGAISFSLRTEHRDVVLTSGCCALFSLRIWLICWTSFLACFFVRPHDLRNISSHERTPAVHGHHSISVKAV